MRKPLCVNAPNNEVMRPIERSEVNLYMNETLSSKDETDHNYFSHNDEATWPEVLTHNMRVEMIQLAIRARKFSDLRTTVPASF